MLTNTFRQSQPAPQCTKSMANQTTRWANINAAQDVDFVLITEIATALAVERQNRKEHMNFKLNDVEQHQASAFSDKHCHKDRYKGAIGGHLIYSFTPNSIGCAAYIKCDLCGQDEDITDYDAW